MKAAATIAEGRGLCSALNRVLVGGGAGRPGVEGSYFSAVLIKRRMVHTFVFRGAEGSYLSFSKKELRKLILNFFWEGGDGSH